jgi:hypothetical protein
MIADSILLVFSGSNSMLSKVIKWFEKNKEVTEPKFSHCGITVGKVFNKYY